jgi:Flp pilus assembly protein TadD
MKAPPSSMPPEVHGLLRQASGLLERGQIDEAEALCRRAMALAPRAPDAVHLLALVHRRRGEESDAERLIRESLALAPRRADFYSNYGNLLGATGRIAEAERSYRYALQLDPGFRPARLALARLLTGAGHAGPAEQELRTLLAADPGDAESWAALGASLVAQDRLPEAESAYRRALELAPRNTLARHNLGSLLSRMGRAAEALAELDRAAAGGLGGRALHFNRARALVELTRFDEAERQLAAALAFAPGDQATLALQSKIRFMRADPDFTRGLREAIASHPGHMGLRLTHATMLREAGRLDEAAMAFEEAIAVLGPHPAYLTGLALTLQAADRPAAAVEPAQRAFDANPDDPGFGNALASILLCAALPEDAWPVIRRLRERYPHSQEPIAHEAVAARLLGRDAYGELYDYDRFVRPYDLETPTGYADMAEFNAALLSVLDLRHRWDTHPLDQSLRSGTQTPGNLLTDPDPAIRAFLEALAGPIADYRSRIGQDPGHPLEARNVGRTEFAGCWSVRLRRGGYHVNHIHPQGWLSSAYYVHTPADASDPDHQCGWIKFGEPRFPVPGVLPERILRPHPGRLVLFPSYMWHGTTPITTDEPRVTIAFDVVAKQPG